MRIIAILLTLAMVFTLAACSKTPSGGEAGVSGGSAESGEQVGGFAKGTAYAEDRTLNKTGAVSSVDNLKNTYYKLTTEKKLNVVYLGGSVTNGTGGTGGYCWRSATTEWLKTNFPNAEITDTNAGWGGTGSYWGFFRMDESVLPKNPDLVFVEFAINDAYAGHDGTKAATYMEGIVNKIREKNDKCDIVFILVTDNNGSGRLGKEYEQLLAHKEVAAHYGIPTINVGFALVEEMNKTGKPWEYYVTDIVHPNNEGYKVYADCIAKELKAWLVSSPDKSGSSAHEMPANALVSNRPVSSEIVKAEALTNHSGFVTSNSKANAVAHVGQTLYGAEGAVIEFEFEGRGLGMLVDGSKSPIALITVDNETPFTKKFRENIYEDTLLENLNYGKHTVKIEIISGSKIVVGGFLVAK